MNAETSALLDSSLCGKVCESLKRGDEFGATVWITAVVNCIDPDEDVESG